MAKPDKNSYVLTVVLRDVGKDQALRFAQELENVADKINVGYPDVFTAHLKDENLW